MDEGSDSRIASLFKRIFGSNEQQLEAHILEASAEGEIDREEVSMLLNILGFDQIEVSEIMVPRTDMICVDVTGTLRDVADAIVNQGAHSRIPVFKENKDHIIGVIHAKDLLGPLLEGNGDLSVHDIMRPVYFVPEDMSLDNVLSTFKREKLHMAIVVDEYGGTSGMVTMEDVLEEIVGDISDEYDQDRPDEIRDLGDGAFVVSGRVPLDEVCEHCSLELESGEVDSIGGFLAAMAGRIPKVDEFFTFDGKRFTVLEADDRQIWSIKIEPLEG
ncbi:MAG: hemolysin family protein [Pseudodesulfovibrio sp.]